MVAEYGMGNSMSSRRLAIEDYSISDNTRRLVDEEHVLGLQLDGPGNGVQVRFIHRPQEVPPSVEVGAVGSDEFPFLDVLPLPVSVAAIVGDLEILPVNTLREAVDFLLGKISITPVHIDVEEVFARCGARGASGAETLSGRVY